MTVSTDSIVARSRDSGCRPACLAPCLALITINCAAAGAAAVWLLGSGALPAAMAAHGAMMIVAWGCLLPLGGLVARYFKVTPRQDFPRVVENPFWWNCHRALQYAGAALATAAAATILWQTGGHVATLHGRCGLAVMTVAWLQVASPLFRGSKGGPTGAGATAADAGTWRGDHFDMTRRRRVFEAWHKPAGWTLIVLGQLTILLGLDLVDAPAWILGVAALMMAALGLALLDSYLRGRWVDTHEALWGPGMRPRPPAIPDVGPRRVTAPGVAPSPVSRP